MSAQGLVRIYLLPWPTRACELYNTFCLFNFLYANFFFFFHNHFIYICTQVQLNTNFAVYNAVIKRDLNNEPLCWWFWLIRSRDDYYETAMSGRERRFTDKRVTPRRLSLIYLGLSLIRLLAFSYIPLVAWIILEGSADRCIIFGNVFMYYCEFKPSYTF